MTTPNPQSRFAKLLHVDVGTLRHWGAEERAMVSPEQNNETD